MRRLKSILITYPKNLKQTRNVLAAKIKRIFLKICVSIVSDWQQHTSRYKWSTWFSRLKCSLYLDETERA